MKFKVLEDVSLSVGGDKDQTFKAGVVEPKESNRAALDKLVALGLAEAVKEKGD